MKRALKNRDGFTLVELIIVIAILAVLALAAMLGYSNLSESARETAEKANAGVVVRSLNTYNQLVGTGTKLTAVPAVSGSKMPLELKTSGGALVDLDLTIDAADLSAANSSVALGNVLGWVEYNAAGGRFTIKA